MVSSHVQCYYNKLTDYMSSAAQTRFKAMVKARKTKL